MDCINRNVATNLKNIRKEKHMSLDILAEKTGVSKSMLGQIERGESNPTIGTLNKIVTGLRITLDELVRTPPTTFLIKADELEAEEKDNGAYTIYTYFSYEEDKKIEMYKINVKPGGYYVRREAKKLIEYVTVTAGKLIIVMEDGQHILEKDDVIRFRADKEHTFFNKTDEELIFTVLLAQE